jgi:hypothetical protein
LKWNYLLEIRGEGKGVCEKEEGSNEAINLFSASECIFFSLFWGYLWGSDLLD